MEIVFLPQAKHDFEYWKKSGNKTIFNKIKALLNDIRLHPFEGIGKPEPLKNDLRGLWSRRINKEHRLLYEVENGQIRVYVLSMRYNYSK